MARGLTDTTPEAAKTHLDLLRAAPPGRRLLLGLSLSRTVMALARDRLAQALPDATPQELAVHFVAALYGPALADEVRAHLAAGSS